MAKCQKFDSCTDKKNLNYGQGSWDCALSTLKTQNIGLKLLSFPLLMFEWAV